VVARDLSGNVDAMPALAIWTVDTQPPETTINAFPPVITNVDLADFGFGSDEPGSFECKLDSEVSFTPCADPRQITGLADGAHVLEVRAIDRAGNVDQTPAAYNWMLDRIDPNTFVDSGPAAQTASVIANFDFSASEAGVSYECKLDGATTFIACSDPLTVLDLTEGSHVLEVRAIDLAGNTDQSPASHSWVVDLVGPDTTIVAGPSALTNQLFANFDFTSSEPNATYECQVDSSGIFASCPNPLQLVGLSEGAHSIEVRSVDLSLNVDPTPATFSWVIDVTPPETTVATGPQARAITDEAEFTFSSGEAGGTFECKLDGAAAFTACTSSQTYTALAEGNHVLEVRARDGAGNEDPSPALFAWEVLPELRYKGAGCGCGTGTEAAPLALAFALAVLARRCRRQV
jgi:hypothetical protein